MNKLNGIGIVLMMVALCLPLSVKAQGEVEFANLAVNVQMPENEEVSAAVLSSLQDRLYEAVSLNALGSTDGDSRFVILPIVNVISKNVTTSIPPQFVAEVEIALYFADNYTRTILSQVVISKKAMDDSETKAVSKAVKSLQARDKKIKRLFDAGKKNLAEYFATHTEGIEVVGETDTDWILNDKD